MGSALLLLVPAVTHAGAQQPDRAALEHLEQVYAPDVVDRVADVLERAETERLPLRPLADKALEGAAKRVPGDRLVKALERRRAGLGRAAEALGERTDPASLKAGATALEAGAGADGLRRIGEVAPAAERPTALVVLGELHRLGVPADRAVEAVTAVLQREGGRTAGLSTLPARVRAAARHGARPGAALTSAVQGRLPGGVPAAGPGVPSPPGVAVGPPVPPGTGPPSELPRGDDPPAGPPRGSGG